jgi:glyoxylase-like metal-dependent hydrolase (beta-lactamase superfamily II)
MGDDTVFIASSPFETENTKKLMTWIRRKFGPVKVIDINTHFHADGTGGNEGFNEDNVEIWSSDLTKKLLVSKGPAMRKETLSGFTDPELRKRLEKRRDMPAPNTFELAKGKQFNFKNESVEVIFPGPAHSPDNVVVYMPQRQVMFGGCMIRSADSKDLGFLGNANVDKWEESARNLLQYPVKIVIPGHGAVGGPELIQHTVELAALRAHPTSAAAPVTAAPVQAK